MHRLSRTPEQHLRKDKYLKRQIEAGADPDDPDLMAMCEFFDRAQDQDFLREQTPDWEINNLEYDLRSVDWILQKVRDSEIYAQNLYAAMCNNCFQKLDVMPILKNETWTCSWRYAGSIVAHMRQSGSYMDWYCSGIADGGKGGVYANGFVSESVVTAELRSDLEKLGWRVEPIWDNE